MAQRQRWRPESLAAPGRWTNSSSSQIGDAQIRTLPIRDYFTDDGDQYLIGDFVIGIGFTFFFLPFLVNLRSLLGWAEGGPNIWSWVTLLGGFTAMLGGFAASAFWSALALGAISNSEIDDSSIRTLMYLDAAAFAGLGYGLSLMVVAASLIIYRTGVLGRWLAPVGLIVAVCLAISPLWVVNGDEEGGFFGIIGFLGVLLWVLIISIGMAIKRELPARSIA